MGEGVVAAEPLNVCCEYVFAIGIVQMHNVAEVRVALVYDLWMVGCVHMVANSA